MKKHIWINGTSDIMFKTIMRSEQNKNYVAYIISEITKIPEQIILKNLRFNPVEFIKEKGKEKIKRSDLILELDMAIINMEMNKTLNESIYKRNIAYMDKINSLQYSEKEDYKNGKLVIQINFDEKKYPGDKIKYKWITMEEELKISYIENKEIYTIDLEKIKEKCYNGLEMNNFEKSIAILVSRSKEEARKIAKSNEILERVVYQMEELNKDSSFIGMYDVEEENKKLMNSMKLEGIEEGIEVGIESEKIEIAHNLLKQNVDINIISESTGLSIEQIENLKI